MTEALQRETCLLGESYVKVMEPTLEHCMKIQRMPALKEMS